jgi:hypothetical protein
MSRTRLLVVIVTVLGLYGLGWEVYWQHQPIATWLGSQGNATELAALVSALATGVIAGANYFLIRATADQASASKQTIRELQRDRSLQWSPYVVARRVGDNVDFHNVGRGSALWVFYCRLEKLIKSWHVSDPVPLLSGEKRSVPLNNMPAQKVPPADILPSGVLEAWFCQDQLGRRFRFLVGQAVADVWDPSEPNPAHKVWADWVVTRNA